MRQEYLDILAGSPLFRGMERENIESMLQCLGAEVRAFTKNDWIAVAGEASRGIGLVLRGEVAVIKESAAGNRMVMAFLQPGGMFGEMAVFSKEGSWPASVQALGPCDVIFITGGRIVAGCGQACPWHFSLIRNLLQIITEKALHLNQKVEYLTIKSMRGKIATFLLEQYLHTGKTTFMLPLNRNQLADFLNVSRPSMSREMARMKAEGVIDFHRASIRILHVDALKGMVQRVD